MSNLENALNSLTGELRRRRQHIEPTYKDHDDDRPNQDYNLLPSSQPYDDDDNYDGDNHDNDVCQDYDGDGDCDSSYDGD